MHRPMTPTALRGCAALLGVAALCVTIAPAPARADTVTDWNGYASTAIVATAGQPPPVSVLSFAMVQGAVYDAVNAIDRGHRPYLSEPAAGPSDSKDAAAATAAFRVLVALFPPSSRRSSRSTTARSPPSKTRHPARRPAASPWVRQQRRRCSPREPNDGRFGPFTPVIGTTPGVWRPTPPLFAHDPAPWVGERTTVPGPRRRDAPHRRPQRAHEPRLRAATSTRSRSSAHCTARRAPRTRPTPRSSGKTMSSRLWNRVFRTLAAPQHLDIVDSARLLATENLAAADAAIGCWNNKYHWNSWRPITAIREAASDGNPATNADPTWTPLFDPSTPVATPPPLVTPPFPDHPSGHNCAAGAIVQTLQALLRHRQDRLQRIQQQVRDHADLRPLLRRARGEHQRARVGRNPLPHRGRPRRDARREGRALPPQALPPTRPLTGPTSRPGV